MSTTDKFEDFVAKFTPAAEKVARVLVVPVEAVLAQWAYESGYGQSRLSKEAHNFGGIKAGKSWKGKVLKLLTKEKDGTETEHADFRSYDSALEYADDYLALMENTRYRFVGGANTAYEFGMRLGRAGYHQDTPEKYAEALESIAQRLGPIYFEQKKNGMTA